MKRCTCTGDPQRDPCIWCERRISRAEADGAEAEQSGWMELQDGYERWLDRIAP